MRTTPLAMVATALCLATTVASAATKVYKASLSGAAESPSVPSPGTGTATVTIDETAHTMRVQVSFQDLLGNTTASHIHCCNFDPVTGNASVATTTPSFVGFPLGVTSGSMDQTYDTTLASSFRAGFVTGAGGTIALAEQALWDGMATGKSYLNIHTSLYPSGEIRGFLAPVPEPSTYALMLLGLVAVGATARRRHT